ncbi:GNAT family N-acetyltransferase [Candidatus Woesearchaeota archaeon]|nr:GNAT family N-acetyltransferase [Candidatus Woesearchaeota archaeon]
MNLRYAVSKDLGFLVEGLEKNRVIENRDKRDIKAKASDKKEFNEAISKKNIRVVEDNGKPIAFLYFRTDFKIMYIYDKFFWVDLIYVKENYRGKGIGKLLYQDAIKIARSKGFNKMVIDVFDSNKNSMKFHEKLGFKPIYAIYKKKI